MLLTALSQKSPCEIIIEHLFNNCIEAWVLLCYDVFDKPRYFIPLCRALSFNLHNTCI